jgi:transposase
MAGRKKILTDEIQTKLCYILENGTTVKDACALVGIGERTFYEWVAIGNAYLDDEDHARMPRKIADRERFAQFAQATTHARSKMRDDVIKSLVSFARAGDSKAAMFLLERSDPTNWGRQTTVKGEVKMDININIEVVTRAWQALEKAGKDPELVFGRLAEQAERVQ